MIPPEPSRQSRSWCVLSVFVLLACGASALRAQGQADRVRAWNAELLRRYSELQQASPAQQAALRSEAAPVISSGPPP